MKNLSPNNIYDWPLTIRLLILGLLAVIVFYLCYMWDISSLSTHLQTINQKEQDDKNQLQLVILKREHLKDEIAQSKQIQDVLNEWKSKIISYASLPVLMNEILKIGSNDHVQFALFQPGKEVKEGDYFAMPIQIVAVGNYHQLANFVSHVANMPWIAEIENFTITSEVKAESLGQKLAEQAATENLLTANFNIGVHYIAENKNAKAP